ncbi:MAG: glycosyltransferase [Pseudomonadota bacterium]
MPDIPWRILNSGAPPRTVRLPVWISWRLQRLREQVVLRVSRSIVVAVTRIRLLHGLPRSLLIPFERALLGTRAADLVDRDFYLDVNADVREAGVEPLRHYLSHGWREGRSPNPRFDDQHYRLAAGMAPGAPVSALGHFLAIGERADIAPHPRVSLADWSRRHPEIGIARSNAFESVLGRSLPARNSVADVRILRRRLAECRTERSASVLVDVVMPVFRGHAETLNALLHVLTASNRTAFRVLVIDDQIPYAALKADIRRLAKRGLIDLVEQPQNSGFVAATNKGMRQNPDRDVVWLNADTEVYDGWLDRLRAAAFRMPNVATVTPLSNNATICSYPRIDTDNSVALEQPWRVIDRLAAQENAGQAIEAPTAVGFATYVRRDAIDAIGYLDESSFGRGYGEENDFSQRAIAAGWRNLIAADTLVRHFGGVSFGAEKSVRVDSALAVLDRMYPRYRADVQRFLAEDPLRPLRRRIDLARMSALRGRKNVLIITHSLGGGTKQHVESEIARLADQDTSVFVLTGDPEKRGKACLSHPEAGMLPTLEAMDFDGDELWDTLGSLSLDNVLIHHLIDFEVDAPKVLRRRLTELGVGWSFTVHDYLAVCPRINMVDLGGMYCGEPDVAGCRRCLLRRGSQAGRPDIIAWRGRYQDLLREAQRVIVPDRDVANRLRGYFPDLENVSVIPHEKPRPAAPALQKTRRGPLKVAVLGAIGPIKGIDILMATALRAQRDPTGPQFTVIGYTHNDRAARACGISVTGPYDNADVELLLEKTDPDVIWIPSIWPETYCYTLSIALRSGLPIMGFAIGAIATRLSDVERGHLVPLVDAARPERLIEALELAAFAEEKVSEVA